MGKINRDKLVFARSVGMTLQQTADVCGVSKRTVQRELEDDEVQRRIEDEQARTSAAESAAWRAREQKALGILDQLMDSSDERNQLRAAQTVLQSAGHRQQLREIAERQNAVMRRLLEVLSANEEDLEWDE